MQSNQLWWTGIPEAVQPIMVGRGEVFANSESARRTVLEQQIRSRESILALGRVSDENESLGHRIDCF